MRTLASIILVLLLSFSAAPPLFAGELKTFSREITGQPEEYTIEVGGKLDPHNVELAIENLGDSPVKDPRLTVNGLYDWFDIHTMAAEITRGCTTDEEKALAIWEWILWKRYQLSPFDLSAAHPVRGMNGFGYGICGHSAYMLKALCLAAGVQARVQEIWGHTVNEAFWDGKWHFLDSNVKVYYLGRDNRTLASLAELEKEPWLIQRTIHPRDPWVKPIDPPGRNEEFVRYIVSALDNYVDTSSDSVIFTNYSMAWNLKPGMKLLRWWEPRLAKFEGSDKRAIVPSRYANGQIIWEPDLDKLDMKDYIEVVDNVTTKWSKGGKGPAIQVDYLQDDQNSRPSRVKLPLDSPWPAVGGRFSCTMVKDPGCAVSVFYGEPEWSDGNLYTYRWGSGRETDTFDLDHFIRDSQPAYHYDIGFMLNGRGKGSVPRTAGVDWFRSETDLQISPHAIPALKLGRNVIRYWDASPGQRKVRITFTWREVDDNHAPSRVSEAVSPKEAKSLTPVLEWKAVADPDPGDSVADYQVMLSLRPDCRWPLSNTVYRNLGSGETRWQVPATFLNPGTTYYWKVRSRDSRGAISDWGEIFSFTTSAKAK